MCVVAQHLQVTSPKPSGVSTSWLLRKYLQDIKRRGRENRMEKKRRAREGQKKPWASQALLLLASSQRFFCETRGQANRVSLPLTSASSSIKHYHIHRNQVCPKALSSVNEANQRSHPVRWSYQCLAKTEDHPNPADNMRWKTALLFLLLETPRNQ